MNNAERVIETIAVVLEQGELVPKVAGMVRRGDDTMYVGDVSVLVKINEVEEHETLDRVWNLTGCVRLYIKESARSVHDDARREWLGVLEEYFRDDEFILADINSVDVCVQWFRLEQSGVSEWESDGRDLWCDVEWEGVVNF